MNRRDFLRLSALAAVPAAVPALAACGKGKRKDDRLVPPVAPGGGALQSVGAGAAPGLQIGEAEAELLVGSSRLSFGLRDPDNTPVTDATVTAYLGRDPAAKPLAQTTATWLRGEVAAKAIYVADLKFPAAGEWLLAVVAETKDGVRMRGGIPLQVLAASKSPVPGGRAVPVATPTVSRPLGADPLCSRRPKPCSMHAISLDAALRSGRPTVVTFAAPAFCTSELCGPVVDIVDGFARQKGSAANFVHVEAYRSDGKVLTPAMRAWHFTAEPWTYFIDAKGTVADRLSAALGSEEVARRLAALGV